MKTGLALLCSKLHLIVGTWNKLSLLQAEVHRDSATQSVGHRSSVIIVAAISPQARSIDLLRVISVSTSSNQPNKQWWITMENTYIYITSKFMNPRSKTLRGLRLRLLCRDHQARNFSASAFTSSSLVLLLASNSRVIAWLCCELTLRHQFCRMVLHMRFPNIRRCQGLNIRNTNRLSDPSRHRYSFF